MKYLFACRHAKALPPEGMQSDFDRKLSDRGIQDAEAMGRIWKDLGIELDVVLSSPSRRTLMTAERVTSALAFPPDRIKALDPWYLGGEETWLAAVQQIDEESEVAAIFGHNPGIHYFANRLCRESGRFPRFRTMEVAHFEIDVEYWAEISWGEARLIRFLERPS